MTLDQEVDWISMRKNLIATLLMVALLVVLLVPLSWLLSIGLDAAEMSDADHMIQPMLDMLAQSPKMQAQVPVEPVMDIEDAWTIEDTREELWEMPLVIGMRDKENELGFDAQSNTFYCTLGLDDGEDWPELALFAQGAQGKENLRVAWIDDYTYDYRSDAIREGYRYELLAYTDTHYAYLGIVFTGLPTVSLHVHGGADALGDAYTPARVNIASTEHEAINASAWIHVRGGGSIKPIDKESYRIEFHDYTNRGDEKTARSVLGMSADTDWLLIGNAQEPTAIRNHLCWEMWRMWNEGASMITPLESRLVELFVDDEYMGLYQVLERIDIPQEIIRIGGSAQTDTVARCIVGVNIDEYPVLNRKEEANLWIEHRYAARDNYKRTFARIEDYVRLMLTGEQALSDEEFVALAQKRVSTREMISYYLFSQVCGLSADNIFNNLYIWALDSKEGYMYYVSPWDMDLSLSIPTEGMEVEKGESLEMSFSLPCRMLDLNVDHARDIMWEIWQEKRASVISDDGLYAWIEGLGETILASGAYARETEKWYGEAKELATGSILYYTMSRVKNVENGIREIWPAQNMTQQ